MERAAAAGLMLALDLDDLEEAVGLVRELGSGVAAYKVGSQLFSRFGPASIDRIREAGGEVFLDLKFHDIPNTVYRGVKGVAERGISWFTVHASGGSEMVAAAKEAAGDARLLAVTVLTSMGGDALRETGCAESVRERVLRLASLAMGAGADGIVCSPLEVASLRAELGSGCVLVTPGIRPAGAEMDDQNRVSTPAQALQAGSDYLVVGRPVTRAPDRKAALERIRAEMLQA